VNPTNFSAPGSNGQLAILQLAQVKLLLLRARRDFGALNPGSDALKLLAEISVIAQGIVQELGKC